MAAGGVRGGSRRGRAAGPAVPATVRAQPGELSPDEVDLLCFFWVAEALPGVFSKSDRPVAMDWYHLASLWARRETGGPGGWGGDEARARVQGLAIGLRAKGYVVAPDPSPYSYGSGISLTPAGRAALAGAVPVWWADAGVTVPAGAVRQWPGVQPADAVATFARLLATADGLPVGANGRPSAAAQRGLARCLPPAAAERWIGESAAAREDAAQEDEGEDEDLAGHTTPWSGYDPRLGVWLAAASYEGLLSRVRGEGTRARWGLDEVVLQRWFEAGPAIQWQRLVASWSRAAAAAPVARLALMPFAAGGPPEAWIVPERLLAWLGRYTVGARAYGRFVQEAVVGGAAALGAGVLGVVEAPGAGGSGGSALAFSLTDAGRRVLQGLPPEAWEPPAPPAVGSDLTVIEPLAADPEAAFCLRRIAELEGVDRAVTHRLTRAAWTAARERGDDPLDLWAAATDAVRQPVPQNVTFTLEQDWSDSVRTATLESVVLLRFPTEEVAAMARREPALRRRVAEELSATAWVVAPGGEAAVRRALKKVGIAAGAPGGKGHEEAAAAAGRAGKAGTRAKTPAATLDESGFRLPWPGPFGQPASDAGPVRLLQADPPAPPVPTALVRMPPQAIYRRLWLASKNGEEIWVDLPEEGFVRFVPEQVTRRTLYGTCRGCGGSHTLDLGEVRALLDHEAYSGY